MNSKEEITQIIAIFESVGMTADNDPASLMLKPCNPNVDAI